MHTLEAIQTRRAVRGYDPEFTLSQAEKDELLELALLQPQLLLFQE